MLIWLSSYPRSGNTFLRILLNEIFGVKTYSWTGEGDHRVFSSRPGVIDAVGHLNSPISGEALIDRARRSDQIYIIKTHEPPLTDDPAVYIVRDGRSAIVSYYHFMNEIIGTPTEMESIIQGNVYAGSWSDHFTAWQPLVRPRTLLLRYEDIIKHKDDLIERAGDFIGSKPKKSEVTSFDDLHSLYPQFFRGGSDAKNISECKPYLRQFMTLHGDLLQRLGYADNGLDNGDFAEMDCPATGLSSHLAARTVSADSVRRIS